MYSELAELYDAFYDWKDYEAEAKRLNELIRDESPRAHTLLDVACGTGRHLERLVSDFDVQGLDIEPRLLAVARRRLPTVPLHRGDMRSFDIGRTFDVVTCLFSSIGYMRTSRELREAVSTMARHVASPGTLIMEPWLAPEHFDPHHLARPIVVERDHMAAVRMNGSRVEGHLSVLEFHYLVGRPGEVRHLTDTHELGLFTREEYEKSFRAAGLDVRHDPEGLMGRGLYIGRKPGAPVRAAARDGAVGA